MECGGKRSATPLWIERLVLRWIRHKPKPKRRRASLAAALHMAVAETFNAPGQILTSAATRLLLTYSRVKQQSFDFIIRANHISRLRELCGTVRIGNGDDLHAGGNAGRDTRF